MLLFQKRFWPGLTGGAITLTFRRWQKPLVRPGGRYRCHPIGVLEVDAIDRIRLADIDESEARLAGFEALIDLHGHLATAAEAPLTPETMIFRVTLHHGGDGDRVASALDEKLTTLDLETIREKLAQLDSRSPIGPFTAKTLALISRRPRIAASQLAKTLNRDKAEFKTDVVKLKRLGLTQSFEVGYEISPRGRAYLTAIRKSKSPRPSQTTPKSISKPPKRKPLP